jgi:hypothetical protein
MNKRIILILVISITIILAFFVGIYLSVFNSSLSSNQSDWGSSGSYFAGTIGICFSLLGIVLIYLTFFEQRKQQFENTFQQYISNYYSLVNLIKERWLHTECVNGTPIYKTGREIFGTAVGFIKTGREKETFIEIFSIHNNVFQHYCNYLVELFKIIDSNNELTNKTKGIYIDRFLSMLSTFELVFFAYYTQYLYENLNSNEIKLHLQNKLKYLKLTDEFPHNKQIEFIIRELK